MATKLITVRKAKEEIKRLQFYVDLVEDYEANTLEKLIIKEYAFENSITQVVNILERRGITRNGQKVDFDYVRNVINGRPTDELHKMMKSGYNQKTKSSRRKSSGIFPYV
jgi:hypothetical protein